VKIQRFNTWLRLILFPVFVWSLFRYVNLQGSNPISDAVLISLLGVLLVVLAGGLKEHPFDPWNQIIVVWLLIGVFHPLARSSSTEPYSRGQLGLNVVDSLPRASLILSLGSLVTLAGIASVSRRDPSISTKELQPSTISLKKGWEAILVCVWLLGTLLLIQRIGLSGLSQWRSRETQATLLNVSSYLWFTNYLLAVPALLRLLRVNRSKRDLSIGLALLYAPVGVNVLSGNRIFVIPIMILHFSVYSIRKRELKMFRVILLLLIVFIAISGLRGLRESTDPYSSYNRLNFIEKQNTLFEGQDMAMLDNLSLLVKSNARNPDFPLIDYFNIFTKPVPRQLWPSKPRTFDQKVNELILPSQSKAGYGFSFTFIGESFYEFGIVGVVFVSYFFGLFLGYCTRWVRNTHTTKLQLVGLVTLSLIVVFFRGSFSADSPRLIFALLPLLLISSSKSAEVGSKL